MAAVAVVKHPASCSLEVGKQRHQLWCLFVNLSRSTSIAAIADCDSHLSGSRVDNDIVTGDMYVWIFAVNSKLGTAGCGLPHQSS